MLNVLQTNAEFTFRLRGQVEVLASQFTIIMWDLLLVGRFNNANCSFQGLLRKAASCAIGCLTKDGKYATTEVVTKLEWDALGDSGQKSLFAQKNVLVKGMLPAALNPMQEFNLQEMSKIVDTFAQLQARGAFPLVLRKEERFTFS